MKSKNPTWQEIKREIRAKVSLNENGCWLWAGALLPSGYARIWGEMAHRMSYQAFVGPIGKGLDIDHLCRNRACINPAHLEPVTRQINLARGVRKAQQQQAAKDKRFCGKGHALTKNNTYVRPSDGSRLCRKCRKSGDEAYREANKEKVNARKRAWRKSWRGLGIRK